MRHSRLDCGRNSTLTRRPRPRRWWQVYAPDVETSGSRCRRAALSKQSRTRRLLRHHRHGSRAGARIEPVVRTCSEAEVPSTGWIKGLSSQEQLLRAAGLLKLGSDQPLLDGTAAGAMPHFIL